MDKEKKRTKKTASIKDGVKTVLNDKDLKEEVCGKNGKASGETSMQDCNSKKGGKSKNSNNAPKIKVLFICTGNTCRSPMAEQLFKQFLRQKKELSLFEVGSAGLYACEGQKMNSNAEKALQTLNVKPKPHLSRQLTEAMAENADLLICMTAGHKALIEGCSYVLSIGELTGASDVPDPYGGDLDRYLAVAQYLEYACTDIYNAVQKTIR